MYASAARYIGSRIHGAIPSLIHGACVDVLYLVDKARVIENSTQILAKYVDNIAESIRVFYIKDRNIRFRTDLADPSPPDQSAVHSAIAREKVNIQERLKQAASLSEYCQ
jgi:hypothetical protein